MQLICILGTCAATVHGGVGAGIAAPISRLGPTIVMYIFSFAGSGKLLCSFIRNSCRTQIIFATPTLLSQRVTWLFAYEEGGMTRHSIIFETRCWSARNRLAA